MSRTQQKQDEIKKKKKERKWQTKKKMKAESKGERMNEGMDRYCSPGNNGNEKTLCMRVPVTNCTTLSLAVCSVQCANFLTRLYVSD